MDAKLLTAAFISAIACLFALYFVTRKHRVEGFSVTGAIPGGAIDKSSTPLQYRYETPHARYDASPKSLYGMSQDSEKFMPSVTGNARRTSVITSTPNRRILKGDTSKISVASGNATPAVNFGGGSGSGSGGVASGNATSPVNSAGGSGNGVVTSTNGSSAVNSGGGSGNGVVASTNGSSAVNSEVEGGSGANVAESANMGCIFDWPDVSDEPLVIGDGAWNFTKHRDAVPCSHEEILPANGVRFGSELGGVDYIASCTSACVADDKCHGMVIVGDTCTMYTVKDDERGFKRSVGHNLFRKTAACLELKTISAVPSGAFGRAAAAVFDGYEPCEYSVINFSGAGLVDENYRRDLETTLEITSGDSTRSCAAMCQARPECEGYIVKKDDENAQCDLFRQTPGAMRKLKKSPGYTTVYTANVDGLQHSLFGGKVNAISATEPHCKIWDQYSGGVRVEKLIRDAFRKDNEEYKIVLHGVDCGDTKKVILLYDKDHIDIDASQPGVGSEIEVHSFRGLFLAFRGDVHSPPKLKLDSKDIPTAAGPDGAGRLVSLDGPLVEGENTGYLCRVSKRAKETELSISWNVQPAVWRHGYVRFTGFVLTKDLAVKIKNSLNIDNVTSVANNEGDPGMFVWATSDVAKWISDAGTIAINSMPIPEPDPFFTAEPNIVIGVGRTANSTAWIYKIYMDPAAIKSDAKKEYVALVSKSHPTRCLTRDEVDGMTVRQCSGVDSQMFHLSSIGDHLKLRLKGDNAMCVADVDGSLSIAPCELRQTSWLPGTGYPTEWFHLQGSQNDSHFVTHQPSDAKAVIALAIGGAGQMWQTKKQEDLALDVVSLRTTNHTGKCLTEDGDSYSMLNCSGLPNQSFVLDPTRKGGLRIKGSDKCLKLGSDSSVTHADCDEESSALETGFIGDNYTFSRAGVYLGHAVESGLSVGGFLNIAEPLGNHTWFTTSIANVNSTPLDQGVYWIVNGTNAVFFSGAKFVMEPHSKALARVWNLSQTAGSNPDQYTLYYRDTSEAIVLYATSIESRPSASHSWTVIASPRPHRYWLVHNGSSIYWKPDSPLPQMTTFDSSNVDATVEFRQAPGDNLPPVSIVGQVDKDIEWYAKLYDSSGKVFHTVQSFNSPVLVDQSFDVSRIEFAKPDYNAYYWTDHSGPSSVNDATRGRQGPTKTLLNKKFHWIAIVLLGSTPESYHSILLYINFPDKKDTQEIHATQMNQVVTLKHANTKTSIGTFYGFDVYTWDAHEHEKPVDIYSSKANRKGPLANNATFTGMDYIAVVGFSELSKDPVLTMLVEGGGSQEVYEGQAGTVTELVDRNKPTTFILGAAFKTKYEYFYWDRAGKPYGVSDTDQRSGPFIDDITGVQHMDFVAFAKQGGTRGVATITWTGKGNTQQIVEKSDTVFHLLHSNTAFSIVVEPGYSAYLWDSGSAPSSVTDSRNMSGPYGSTQLKPSFDYIAIRQWHPESSAIAYLQFADGFVQKIDKYEVSTLLRNDEKHVLIIKEYNTALYWDRELSKIPNFGTDAPTKTFRFDNGIKVDYMYNVGSDKRANTWYMHDIPSKMNFVYMNPGG